MMRVLKRARADLESHKTSNKRTRILTRNEEFQLLTGASGLQKGHAVMHSIRQTLSRLDSETYYRSAVQRQNQEIILSGIVRRIYGQDVRNHELEVLEHNGFQSLSRVIGMTMPRRIGKTELVAQLVAVLLLTVENIKIIAVSPSFRAAGGDSGLISHVKRILINHLGFKKFDTNEECIKIHKSVADIRSFHSYPGGAPDK